ncbi:MAG TPA: hypothetical protein HA269_05980 [Ferroplasma sp.]|jgi:hypothetical protein|nr:hypothetical protein [Ferroplasma sp.]
MAWYEVINGSTDSVYNKKLYSIIGQKFGLFYFNKENRIHVFLNTNTRFSFIKQSVELDPIDAMPLMNHYFVSESRKEKDYYDIGVEFNDIKEVIEKLADGQGIMFWFMYYNKKPVKDQYVLQEDKYLVKIIFMQRNDKFMKKKPDEDLNNVILATIQNCIKTDLNWKEIRGKKYRLYSGNIRKPLMKGSKKTLYTYKAKIEDFLELDYSTKDPKIAAPQQSSTGFLDFQREESDTAIVLDTKAEMLNAIAGGEKTTLIAGPSGDGKIGLAARIIDNAEKTGREIAILNTAKFDPFKSLINGNISFSIKRFDISAEYYDRRIVNSAADATALASKLWASLVTGTESLRNPLLIINSVNDLIPLSQNGSPVFENEFWGSFFRYYDAGSNGMGIVFLKDGDQESARLYVDYILKASGEPENRAFDIIKN